MPMTKQTPVITQPAPGTISVAIGPETITFPLSLVTQIENGYRDVSMLVAQMFLILLQNGINPNTASLATMATAIESAGLYWGN